MCRGPTPFATTEEIFAPLDNGDKGGAMAVLLELLCSTSVSHVASIVHSNLNWTYELPLVLSLPPRLSYFTPEIVSTLCGHLVILRVRADSSL